MTLKHLKIFRQVCKDGSVTKAASHLGMNQPAVSLAISELETYYETKLFDRISRKLFLTPAGEKLLEYADKIVLQFEESVNTVKGAGHRTTLKVGLSSNFAAVFAPLSLAEFRKQCPNVELIIYAYASSTLLDMLYGHELDIAVIDCEPQKNLQSMEVFRDDYVLMCKQEFTEKLPDPVKPADLQHIPMILPSTPNSLYRPFYEWLNIEKSKPRIVMYTNSSHTMSNTVGAGLAVLPILRHLAISRMKEHENCVLVELGENKPFLKFSLCTLTGKNVDHEMKTYIEILQKLCIEK